VHPNALFVAVAISAIGFTAPCTAMQQPKHPTSILLGSSAQLASTHGRVRRQINGLISTRGDLTPAQVRAAMGEPGEPLPTVEIEAPSANCECSASATIPFGIAGIFWGLRHPSGAWRLILPVTPS
jgi:hypothetical protein